MTEKRPINLYVDRHVLKKAKETADALGLSLSAYFTLLIHKDGSLQEEPTNKPS